MSVLRPLLLVGQAPSRTGDPTKPCTGRFGRRLAEAAGFRVLPFLASFERLNVLDRFPGSGGRGDLFPMDVARRSAFALRPRFRGRAVVLAGLRVAAAFGVRNPTMLDVLQIYGAREVLIVPHPSGLSLWWNDPENVYAYKVVMRAFMSRNVESRFLRRSLELEP